MSKVKKQKEEKKVKKQPRKNNLDAFSKKLRKKLIIRAILFCSVLLLINTYAWFVFITKVDTDINAHVASWDIQFKDDDQLVRNLDVNVTKINPDMEEYIKEIYINNSSEVNAEFKCEIEEIKLLGNTYTFTDSTLANNKLLNDYPFTVTISPLTSSIDIDEEIVFSIRIIWPYESESAYYKVNDLFTYDSSINYYNSAYQSISVDSTNFDSYIENDNLYIESDDADSYLGSMCGQYQEDTGNYCLSIKLKLIVDQAEDDN